MDKSFVLAPLSPASLLATTSFQGACPPWPLVGPCCSRIQSLVRRDPLGHVQKWTCLSRTCPFHSTQDAALAKHEAFLVAKGPITHLVVLPARVLLSLEQTLGRSLILEQKYGHATSRRVPFSQFYERNAQDSFLDIGVRPTVEELIEVSSTVHARTLGNPKSSCPGLGLGPGHIEPGSWCPGCRPRLACRACLDSCTHVVAASLPLPRHRMVRPPLSTGTLPAPAGLASPEKRPACHRAQQEPQDTRSKRQSRHIGPESNPRISHQSRFHHCTLLHPVGLLHHVPLLCPVASLHAVTLLQGTVCAKNQWAA